MSIGSIGSNRSFDPSQMAAKMVKDLDTNKDNSLSKAEFVDGLKNKGVSQADAENMFNSIDTKGTGKITQSDIETSMKNMGAKGGTPPAGGAKGSGSAKSDDSKVYDKKDTNKDGTVSLLEELAYNLTHQQTSTTEQKSGSTTEKGNVVTGALNVTV